MEILKLNNKILKFIINNAAGVVMIGQIWGPKKYETEKNNLPYYSITNIQF